MKRILFVVVMLLLMSACSGQSDEGDTAVSQPSTSGNSGARATPTNEPVVEPTEIPATAVPDAANVAEEISELVSDFIIVAEDETPIASTIYIPEGEGPFPGVILLHMLSGRRQNWEQHGLVEELTAAGYAVIAVDMRGHGETPGSRDWDMVEQDLIKVWGTFTGLEQVDAENTAVIGGSIGSNMALLTGDNIPEINTVILLSPGLDYRGVMTSDRIVNYGERPLLIVASEEDAYSATSSRTLVDLASDNAELLMLDGAGHGTNMLTETGLRQDIVAWLDANLE